MVKRKKPSKNTGKREPLNEHVVNRLREGGFILCLAVSVYLFISLISYSPTDPSWSYRTDETLVQNSGGQVGAWFADVFLLLFGYLVYLFPVMIGFCAYLLLRKRLLPSSVDRQMFITRTGGFLLTLLAGCGLASLHFFDYSVEMPNSVGGVVGDAIGFGLASIFNFMGATLFLLALFLTGLTLFTGISWLKFMDFLGAQTMLLWEKILVYSQSFKEWRAIQKTKRKREEALVKENEYQATRIKPVIERPAPPPKISLRAAKEQQTALFESVSDTALPPLTLLEAGTKDLSKAISESSLEAMSRLVELKLKDFSVDVQVVAVHPGPVITRYELKVAPGIKASKITGLAKDLARSLSVISVRIVEVIPGKPYVGLEIPNEQREIVRLSDTLRSEAYESARSPLSLALGCDIAGEPVIVDLSKMPHLLVAGTTGSGKSVGLNAMILSLLYKSTPNDVRMIMIDPKMLELSIYNDIPHLLTPVVTDMKEAANALRWCVVEMDRRYQLMAALGVRNITGYNRNVQEARKKDKPLTDPLWDAENAAEGSTPPELETLPFIVVVVDEFADMIMVVGKKVEELICRIAQKARAAGIHLILATQRPSVDVITGLIKANVPTRIAFQVSSRIDSRTILDQQGAEQLLGQGDMLYLPPGTGVPTRVHGAFVADQEVHAVVKDLKKRGQPSYIENITGGSFSFSPSSSSGGSPMAGDEDYDELYDEAVQIVLETRRASISSIQRRLKIGYNRAARLIEQMEAAGLVSPMQNNGTREVIVPKHAHSDE